MRHRRELWLASAATLVVPLLLLAAEAGLRVARPTPCPQASTDELMGCLHVFSPDYGWALRPGIRLCPGFGCVSVNVDANRGPRLPRERAAVGPRRALVLGDSVAFGMDVADGESWPERLARPGLEVVSLAVPGFGTDQELLRLEREGLAYRPDVIVVGFCLANDLVDNALDAFLYSRAHPKPRFALEDGQLRLHAEALAWSAGRRLGNWFAERSVLYNRVLRQGAVQTASEQEEHWQTTSNALLAQPQPLVELATRLLLRIRERGQAAGATLLVVTHPTRRSYAGEAPPWEAVLRERWQREGLAALWLEGAYRERGLAWSDVAVDGTGHLNARGHAVTAELVGAALARAR